MSDRELVFRLVSHDSDAYRELVALRSRILREPLGLAFTEEELAAETGEFHIAAYEGGQLVAGLILVPKPEATFKMRQVAVDAPCQGRGIGRALVRFAERFAKEQGARRIVLNARLAVVSFYEQLGYATEGEPFTEVTIPHWRMTKWLAS